ncbi:transmembrane protein 248 [Anabrus simplex]|uniref:transmembrane protein 248 n=1 Tax=Anabrus simplex TaxID=316456 RepID=UPI0035A3B8CD
MVFSSPLGNLKGFASSRPPLMVFTLCLTAFALTTLSLAYFIRHDDNVPNSDIRTDWGAFLKHLSMLDLCVSPSDESTRANASRPTIDDLEVGDGYGNVSIAVRASLNLFLHPSFVLHNRTFVEGVLPLGEWGNLCITEPSGEGNVLNITMSLPQNLSQSQDVCVTLVGPRSLLPYDRAPPACIPPPHPQGGATARLVTRKRAPESLGERVDNEWCSQGAIMRMTYHSNPEMAVVLTLNDHSLINLHLIHTSYFLFVMAMTLVCYALIKGKPKQKTILIDKVPLDP